MTRICRPLDNAAQQDLFFSSRPVGENYRQFLAMVFDPNNPLTKTALVNNIQRNPATWGCFKGWLKGDALPE